MKRTILSIFLPKLRELQSLAQESTNYDYESAEYRVTAIILDTAQYRMFRAVRSDLLSTDAVAQLVNQNTYNHKDWTRKYCSIKTSHTGVNNMWILKNSTNLLSSLGHLGGP